MNIVIKDFDKKDTKKAIQFAIEGMHFNWYLDSKFLLNAYGRYFWYLELNRATQILAAYIDNRFVGVLLARFNDEQIMYHNRLQLLYVKLVDIIQKYFFKNSASLYDQTVQSQLQHYLQSNNPDGEIIFLAADTYCQIKGIGTALLNALQVKEQGKKVYLFTDNACNYHFYEHKGFDKVEENEIELELPKGKVFLKCFMYHKTL